MFCFSTKAAFGILGFFFVSKKCIYEMHSSMQNSNHLQRDDGLLNANTLQTYLTVREIEINSIHFRLSSMKARD